MCIPYAINLHRKLSERLLPGALPDDVLAMAETLLTEQDQAAFRQTIQEHATSLMSYEPEGSVRRERLDALLKRIDSVPGD